tara:strand:- start:264 stop:977 length:714 start_codon:yes stop_codon:yes gene_type:complete
MKEILKIAIRQKTRKFLEDRISGIEKMRFDDIEINPFLIASIKNQFDMKNQRDLAEWIVNQRVERGLVTAFGGTLQKIAKEFANVKTTPGFTMSIKKNGCTYNILITSGPNPYAKPQAVPIVKRMLESAEREPRTMPVLGMCYGNNDVVSNVVKTEFKEIKYLAGRDFWEFISGDSKCRDEVLEVIYETANKFQDSEKRNIQRIKEKKIKEIEDVLRYNYGRDKNKFWKKLFRDVYI